MDFIINKNQLNLILEENEKDKLVNNLKILNDFSKDLISDTSKTFLINTKIFITWGTSIAGFLYPVDNFIRTNYVDISDTNRNLILIGVFMMLFFNTREDTRRIVNKIFRLGFKNEFKQIFKKSKELRDSFKSFLRGLNITVDQTVELISYSFLIPIVGDITSILNDPSTTAENIELIAKRILGSGLVSLGYNSLKLILKRLSAIFR